MSKCQLGIFRQHSPRKMRLEKFPKPSLKECELPSISIVTPSFMQGDYLERTIQSILKQSYPRLSYIIQDGGSNDKSVEIIRRYESKLTNWESANDGGQSAAVKRGFEKSNGEIMAWLNSDDLLMPDALRFVGEYFATHPTVDVIYGHRVVIDENDDEVGRWVLPQHDAQVLKWQDYVPQETLFWRRNLWNKVGGVDPSFFFALDWDLLIKFQNSDARFVRLPYFLGCFRHHPRQKTCTEMVNSTGDREIAQILQSIHGRAISRRELDTHIKRCCRRGAVTAHLLAMGIRV